MKKLLLFCALLMSGITTYASHIFGGELLYTYVSGNTYHLTLTLYGDCSGAAYPSLDTSKPRVIVYNGANPVSEAILLWDGNALEVSPVCPGQIANTTCHGGTLPGVTRYVYTTDVTISSPGQWSFDFRGAMGAASGPNNAAPGAGRSQAITNILEGNGGNNSTTIIELKAYLDNTHGNNSSPQYTTIPTPFYCVNLQEQYNQGATDPDGDSLVYSLVPALDGNTGISVNYVSPFSATYPLSTASGNFAFDSHSGQMTFTPNLVQDAVIDNQVSEYRNGVLVGQSVREMTFIISADCSDNPPAANINPASIVGGGLAAGNIINICKGTPEVAFSLNVTDADTDLVTAVINNIPAGANVSISNNGTVSPSLNFSWTTASVAPGIYYFYLGLKDDHCPISASPTIAFIINVSAPNTISETLISPTGCVGKAVVAYTLSGGAPPRVITVSNGDSVVHVITDSASIVYDTLAAGNYTVTVNSYAIACPTIINFPIVDSGMFRLPTYNESFCRNNSSAQIDIAPIVDSATIDWYDLNNNLLSGAPIINESMPGTSQYIIIEKYKVCTSYPDTVNATVHDLPTINILNTGNAPCLGDTVLLRAGGGVKYTWGPAGTVVQTDSVNAYFPALMPTIVNVTGTDIYGCVNTDSLAYSNIAQCCQFSYPSAFSPNKDGTNDKYRILTYGNMSTYYLNIYDRFGERVFNTFNESEGWDGNFHGQPCEVGTYFFYFHGKCLTGHDEEQKGTITLVR